MLRAYQWALERRSDSPCVVGAVIDLGNCLDLTQQGGIRAVKLAYQSYIALQKRTGQSIPENKSPKGSESNDLVLRYLDRAVIDHFHANFRAASTSDAGKTREFDTVRAMFPEGVPIYEKAGFLEKTHVQIAVRKQTQILGVFRIPAYQLEQMKIPDLYAF